MSRRPETAREPIDLLVDDQPCAVGAWIVDERFLVDPGPARSVGHLMDALGDWRPDAIALTHVHLDHAGATGQLLERWPGTPVWVHAHGAQHLVAPDRLVASARRVYGDELNLLYGTPRPVPESVVRSVAGGESLGPFDVVYTPGHARHHVSYLHRDSGRAYVGDVAGVRISPSKLVLAPTVAPDIDLAAWGASLERLAARAPSALALTHFGEYPDVEAHLAGAQAALSEWGRLARHLDRHAFTEALIQTIEGAAEPAVAAAYRVAAQPHTHWAGLERYWNTQ